MNRLAELEASMRILKLQNESVNIADSSELLLLSKFMEYKDTHPKTSQREICRALNIPEGRLLTAKKRYGLTKTRKKKKKTDETPSKAQRKKKIVAGDVNEDEASITR
jgi:hypothetical protein